MPPVFEPPGRLVLGPPKSAAAPGAASSDKEPPEAVGALRLSVDVRLVELDAVVLDSRGQPMTGLQKEDFRIMDDGVVHPVWSVSWDAQPLAVALVVDRSGSVAPFMNRIQRSGATTNDIAAKGRRHFRRRR